MRYIVISLLLLAACSKNEQPAGDVPFTSLVINTLSEDTFRMRLMVDEEVVTDSLVAPNGKNQQSTLHYTDPKHRFRLLDAFSNQLYLDTVVAFHPGFSNFITFIQPVKAGRFEYVGPPANEPAPPAGYSKLSIRYTLPALPDQVKIVVENQTQGNNFVASDSFELRRNEYSKYFLALYANNKTARVRFYNPANRATPLATILTVNLGGFNTGFNIYLIRSSDPVMPGQPIILNAEKLY